MGNKVTFYISHYNVTRSIQWEFSREILVLDKVETIENGKIKQANKKDGNGMNK